MKKHLLPASIFLIAILSSFTAASWYTYSSKKLGYQVSFPSKPEEETKKLATEAGKLKMNMVMAVSSGDNMLYLSNATKYPSSVTQYLTDDTIDGFLEKTAEGSISSIKGEHLYTKDIKYGKHPGKEFRIKTKDTGVITMKIYMVGDTMYMLQNISKKGKEDNASAKKFFSSFKLLD
ncbi:hypothetical protein OAH12_01005 [Cyclobacteriaceae bacterium]|nr:hypothetical protein [Cyclobacteriaceae bacterium]